MADNASLPPLDGGCLCGDVRYRATPNHREGYYCHCRMCQLAFGNTRAAFFNLGKAEVAWTKGEPAYYHSSKFARRGHCGRCGTPLCFEYLDSQHIDLAVGTLDQPSALTPTSHFAVDTRIANWHAEDGLPGQRAEEHQRLTERWKGAYGDDVVPGVGATR
jgi:hypothetical protein